MDKKLIDAINLMAEGKEEGFNQVYSETFRHVYFRAKSYMKEEEDTLDLVQIVYIEAYRNIGTLQTPEALYGWLDGITYRQGMKLYRKKKDVLLAEEGEGIFETLENEDITSMPELNTDQKETSKILRELLEELPALQKTAMIAYYFDNLSVQQIADLQECSKGTVQSRLNYGRKYLKEKIEEKERKEGYRLHVFTPATLWFAIHMLAEETTISPQAVQKAYNVSCSQVGLKAENIEKALNIAETAKQTAEIAGKTISTVQTAGKAVGIGGKIASLSAGMKAVVLAGTLAVGAAAAGGTVYMTNQMSVEGSMQEEEMESVSLNEVSLEENDEVSTEMAAQENVIQEETLSEEEKQEQTEEQTQEQVVEEEGIQLTETEKRQIVDAIAYYDSMIFEDAASSYVTNVKNYIQTTLYGDGVEALPCGWNSPVVTKESVKAFYEDGLGISLPENYTYDDYGVTCDSEMMWDVSLDRFHYESLEVVNNGDGTYQLSGAFYWEAEGESDRYTFDAMAVESGNRDVFGGLKITSYTVNE